MTFATRMAASPIRDLPGSKTRVRPLRESCSLTAANKSPGTGIPPWIRQQILTLMQPSKMTGTSLTKASFHSHALHRYCCFRPLLHFVRSAARPSQDIVSKYTFAGSRDATKILRISISDYNLDNRGKIYRGLLWYSARGWWPQRVIHNILRSWSTD